MKRSKWFPLFMIIPSMLWLSGCSGNQKGADNAADNDTGQSQKSSGMTAEQLVQRGEYIVNLGGCHDCHSPKENGPKGLEMIQARMLSGYPSARPIMQGDPEVLEQGWVLFVPDLTSASGPWGVSFSANITSDQTGIGNWTEENFFRALREGKYKGIANSREILPPMPWQNFANVTDEDIRALFLYLKSTTPVSNVVPAAILADKPANMAPIK